MENWQNYLAEAETDVAVTSRDLRAAVEAIQLSQDRTEQMEKLKKMGGLAARIGLGLLTAGLSETVQAAADVGEAISDIYGTITDPAAINSGKFKNQPWVQLLGVDEGFSKIIVDNIETEFLKSYINKFTSELVMKVSPDNPLPNFTHSFAKWLNKQKLKSSSLQINAK
jgi:hypothetical protein